MSVIRILSADDVRTALPMAEAVAAMREAFARLALGEVILPARTHLDVPEHHGVALVMPSVLPAVARIGVKVITLFDGNPDRGLPRIQSVVLVLDAETGTPLAVVDGGALTAIRTGAGSGLATDLMARPDASTAAIFGAGPQGRTQLEGVCAVRPIRRAWVYDPSTSAAQRFAAEMTEVLGVPVEVAPSASSALADADIVCTATVAREPVFADADLRPGTHINAIGSYKPHVQEIPSATVARARVVVDHRESALAETGDLLIPIGQGVFTADGIAADIGEVVLGRQPGRTSAEEITFYKAVGVAVQDVTAASVALDRAEQLGLGATAQL